MPAPRVAVIGAGAAGSAFCWRLLTRPGATASVTLFEMGRGAGGRAGSRRDRVVPDLLVNHGAPLFHVSSTDAAELGLLLDALLASGHVAPWSGSHGTVGAWDGALRTTARAAASKGEPADDPGLRRYVGTPSMSSLARGCLALADGGGGGSLDCHFGVRVSELRPVPAADGGASRVGGGWEVVDKTGRSYGEFDWLVAAGITPALARWRAGFGEEPPLQVCVRALSAVALITVV
jgi:predicted NAD/FAD-dependent oxidoreductase